MVPLGSQRVKLRQLLTRSGRLSRIGMFIDFSYHTFVMALFVENCILSHDGDNGVSKSSLLSLIGWKEGRME
jgi:hypothetical protein